MLNVVESKGDEHTKQQWISFRGLGKSRSRDWNRRIGERGENSELTSNMRESKDHRLPKNLLIAPRY